VEQCFDYGIAGFIRKPFKASLVKRRLKKIVELYMQKNDFKKRLETQTSTLRNQYKLLQKQSEQLKLNNESIINILGTIVEYRNTGSSKHAEHVRKFTEIIGRRAMEMYPEYRLTADKVQVIAAASVLHDIGKIMIPNDVLLKPGRLNEEELECIRSHAIYGYDIINNIAEDWNADYVQYSKEICKYHHERYDGKGYAEGLAGEDIPLSAQIVSIADSFDALISEKVYKRSYSFPVAFQMVLDGQCGAFSPKLLECFRNAKDELAACIEPEEDEPEDDMENPYLD
jgi:putative two-component system response regulator